MNFPDFVIIFPPGFSLISQWVANLIDEAYVAKYSKSLQFICIQFIIISKGQWFLPTVWKDWQHNLHSQMMTLTIKNKKLL